MSSEHTIGSPAVLLLHSTADLSAAQRIHAGLEHEGIPTTIMGVASQADRATAGTSESAAAMAILWSREALSSSRMRSLARNALAGGTLLPITIEEVRPPLILRMVESCDLTGWIADPKRQPDAWNNLVQSARKHLSNHAAGRIENRTPWRQSLTFDRYKRHVPQRILALAALHTLEAVVFFFELALRGHYDTSFLVDGLGGPVWLTYPALGFFMCWATIAGIGIFRQSYFHGRFSASAYNGCLLAWACVHPLAAPGNISWAVLGATLLIAGLSIFLCQRQWKSSFYR